MAQIQQVDSMLESAVVRQATAYRDLINYLDQAAKLANQLTNKSVGQGLNPEVLNQIEWARRRVQGSYETFRIKNNVHNSTK